MGYVDYGASQARQDVVKFNNSVKTLNRYGKCLLNSFLRQIRRMAQDGRETIQIPVWYYCGTTKKENQFMLVLEQLIKLGYKLSDNGPIKGIDLTIFNCPSTIYVSWKTEK